MFAKQVRPFQEGDVLMVFVVYKITPTKLIKFRWGMSEILDIFIYLIDCLSADVVALFAKIVRTVLCSQS